MLSIDGSQGEGGGQILRTSLALSLLTGTPFRITGIRAGRRKPGLMRQHQCAVEAAARVGSADVKGADLGSQEVVFTPDRVIPGSYHFDVGTAGSATLVLQTVLPALLTASAPSTLSLEGGTHNPFAPPFEFLHSCFLPLINRIGPRVAARLDRPGFYPAGGGRFEVSIHPAARLAGIELLVRGELLRRHAKAIVSALPRTIADRELAVVRQQLGLPPECLEIQEVAAPVGPGNVVAIELEYQHVTEVCTAFGQRRVTAEAVAAMAVSAAKTYLESAAPVGVHLADQLILPLSVAGRGAFRSLRPTQHTLTNIEVLRRFLPIDWTVRQIDPHVWHFQLEPR